MAFVFHVLDWSRAWVCNLLRPADSLIFVCNILLNLAHFSLKLSDLFMRAGPSHPEVSRCLWLVCVLLTMQVCAVEVLVQSNQDSLPAFQESQAVSFFGITHLVLDTIILGHLSSQQVARWASTACTDPEGCPALGNALVQLATGAARRPKRFGQAAATGCVAHCHTSGPRRGIPLLRDLRL